MRREIQALLLVLMVFMITASVLIGSSGPRYRSSGTTLALREVAEPSDKPLFMIESASGDRYLRSALGITYTGERWLLEEVPCQYESLSAPSDVVGSLSLCRSEQAHSYRDFNRDVLNQASVIDDPLYMELPENISDRIKARARSITEDFTTPFEKAKAIEGFLNESGYRYNLDYMPAPDDWEPNDWFLFESREGICGNFNSAFVILARSAGIPARLAAGYYVQAGEGAYQVIYADQGHAWAEVWFKGLGWLAFEATPPRSSLGISSSDRLKIAALKNSVGQ